MNKKTLLIIGAVIVSLVAGYFAYRVIAGKQASATSELQTASVQRGALATTLSSSGTARSGQSATITWEAEGKVGEVALKPGDLVKADQQLAALDPQTISADMINARQKLATAEQAFEDLQNSTLQQAQALQALEEAQATLASLKVTASEESSQAQLALANAQIALADAQRTRNYMSYPHSTDPLVIEKAQTDYLLAKKVYKEALSVYNKLKKRNLTDPERARALTNLLAAKQRMDQALATYNWYILDYTPSDIAQADGELAVAQANLEKAQADWENLKDGSSSAVIAMAEASLADAQREWERVKDGPSEADLAAAQADIDAAQAELNDAYLLAPFAGTITKVDVSTGDLVSAGDAAFRIDDLSSIFIDIQISEVDLASLRVGQKATLEFDAIADKQYTGELSEIGMIGTNSQGVVNYPATVRVTDADEDVLPGMTASVTIVLEERDDIMQVPNKAIRTSNGQQSVVVLFEGEQITVPVTVGLVGDTMSEITSSQLQEGDVVVIRTSSSNSSSTTQNNTRSEFMPGGGMIIEVEAGAGGPP